MIHIKGIASNEQKKNHFPTFLSGFSIRSIFKEKIILLSVTFVNKNWFFLIQSMINTISFFLIYFTFRLKRLKKYA